MPKHQVPEIELWLALCPKFLLAVTSGFIKASKLGHLVAGTFGRGKRLRDCFLVSLLSPREQALVRN